MLLDKQSSLYQCRHHCKIEVPPKIFHALAIVDWYSQLRENNAPVIQIPEETHTTLMPEVWRACMVIVYACISCTLLHATAHYCICFWFVHISYRTSYLVQDILIIWNAAQMPEVPIWTRICMRCNASACKVRCTTMQEAIAMNPWSNRGPFSVTMPC